MQYLIWSFEHDAWWKPKAIGYTKDIYEAGIYTESEALTICHAANRYSTNDHRPNEAMIPKDSMRLLEKE